jgi:PAS domain S-box-containing protein
VQIEALSSLEDQHTSQTELIWSQKISHNRLLDSEPERAFDRLTELACHLLHVPIAIISFINGERLFIKSSQGLGEGVPAAHLLTYVQTLCEDVITAQAALVLHDVATHPLYSKNLPIATTVDRPSVPLAAYLGMPLLMPDGHCVGAFCVIDRQIHLWSTEASHTLQELTAIAIDEIDLHIHLHEREQTTYALQASEEQLRLAMEGAQLGAWSRDFTSGRVHYDRRARQILGLPEQPLYQVDDFFARVHPADHTAMHQARTHALQTHTPYAVEFRVIHSNNEIRWVQAKGRTFYQANGQPWRLTGVLMDITERKVIEEQLRSSEQALRVSEERFRSTFDQAAVGIAHVALDGTWLRVNQRACDIVGYCQEDLIKTTFQQITYPDDLAADLEQLHRLIAGKISGYQMEKRYFHRDGSLVWVNLTVSLVQTQGGEPDYFIAVIEDICNRKAAEEALRASEARFRAVQQTTPDGFMIFDSLRGADGLIEDFRWVYTNPAGERLLNRTHEDLLGKQLLIEMPGNRAEGLFDAYVEVVESGNGWQREFAYTHEGLDHWFRSTAAKAGDGFAVAFTDITAQKEAETILRQSEAQLRRFAETLEIRVAERTAELEARNHDLDQFTYVASHDLKAPLRGIDNLASWILEDAYQFLPKASQGHLQKLRGRIVRMEQLLDDLLTYSRADQWRSAPEWVDLAALVASIGEMIAPPEFAVIIAPMPTAFVERVPLETTLRNLIGNAIKHHDRPKQGRVVVSVHEVPAMLEFTVSDNGPGIDPQFHERIFGMFQTLRPRDQVEGSGIGLTIIKKLIESRGGNIVVESQLGAGATFRFSWPKQ